MINIYISDNIYIKAKDIPLSLRRVLKEKSTFKYFTFNGQEKQETIISFFQTKKWTKDELWIKLPANLDYYLPLLRDIEYSLIDNRTKVTLQNFPDVNIELRDNQLELLNQLKVHKFNAVITASTGFGKTLMSVFLAKYLRTTLLFVSAKSSYQKSFKKEVFKWVSNPENNYTEINKDWLDKGAKITPYMSCSVQILKRPEIYNALKDKVGLIILDEIHNSVVSTEHFKGIREVTAKYRIALSASPKIKTEGITECALSNNFVSSDQKLDFSILYQPILLDLQKDTYLVKNEKEFHKRKRLIYDRQDIFDSVIEFVKYNVNNQRNVLVFCTDNFFQNKVTNALNDINIKTALLNKDTKKTAFEDIFRDYDKGIFKVVVGGASLVEAISLYKLSIFLDIELSDTENNVVQKVGRLKRKDPLICDKDKIYYKILFKKVSENKFKYIIEPTINSEIYKMYEYVDLQDTIKVNNTKIPLLPICQDS